ncbi:hypothetical protein GOP47_0030813 [Adiantum capillus-veneris]|nr:hypothetical protein GOP47_0030813 [Adiantum capillus-veneris]
MHFRRSCRTRSFMCANLLNALEWEFYEDLEGKPREQRELGVRLVQTLEVELIKGFDPLIEGDVCCSGFERWAAELEKAYYCDLALHRKFHEEVCRNGVCFEDCCMLPNPVEAMVKLLRWLAQRALSQETAHQGIRIQCCPC